MDYQRFTAEYMNTDTLFTQHYCLMKLIPCTLALFYMLLKYLILLFPTSST